MAPAAQSEHDHDEASSTHVPSKFDTMTHARQDTQAHEEATSISERENAATQAGFATSARNTMAPGTQDTRDDEEATRTSDREVAATQASFATFASRVQNLPAELINMIRDLTLYSEDDIDNPNAQRPVARQAPNIVYVDRDWRHPPTLQVDRRSRQAGMMIYYETSIFDLSNLTLCECAKWADSLDKHLRAFVENIRMRCLDMTDSILDCRALWAGLQAGLPREDLSAVLQNSSLLGEVIMTRWESAQGALGQYHALFQMGFHIVHTRLRFEIDDSGDRYYVWFMAGFCDTTLLLNALTDEYRRMTAQEAVSGHEGGASCA